VINKARQVTVGLRDALNSLNKDGKEIIRFELNEIINRPVEDVFNFVAEGDNAPSWDTKILEIKKLSDGITRKGTKYWMMRTFPQGRAENTFEIIEYEPNKTVSIKVTSGPNPYIYHYGFESVGAGCATDRGTLLSLTAEVEVKGFFNAFRTVLWVEKSLNKVRELLEEGS